MILYAKQEIRSYNRQLLYADAGDEVIQISGLIHESKYGRFTCTADKLTDVKPCKEPEVLRAPKSTDKDQLNLFGL